ncbi:Hypothetical predicted protein, partial [Paramuricea clavata]
IHIVVERKCQDSPDSYSEINFEEYKSVQRPQQHEPVVVPDKEINENIANDIDGPDLMNVNDQGEEELNGEGRPYNEIGNVNGAVQNAVAKNEDQPWNDENIEDPWPT